MSAIEDLLRQAYADAGATVRQEDIAPEPHVLLSQRSPSRRRRLSRIAIPLMAAAATAAVVVVATVSTGVHGHSPAASPPARPSASTGPAEPQVPGPAFFAVLPGNERSIQIFSARTGKAVGHLAPPAANEFFSGVAAEGNGRTLLVAVEGNTGGSCKASIYKLRLTSSGQPLAHALTSLPPIDGILPDRSFTVTPDGSTLAYYAWFCDGQGSFEMRNLRTGSTEHWITHSGDQADSLSLSADGSAVGFSGWEYVGLGPGAKAGTSSIKIRPVTAVLRASSVGTALDGQGIILREYTQMALSPDGATLYVCAGHAGQNVLASYDVATKARIGVLATWAARGGNCAFTLDPSGQQALIASSAGHVAILDIATRRLTSLAGTGLPSSAIMTW